MHVSINCFGANKLSSVVRKWHQKAQKKKRKPKFCPSTGENLEKSSGIIFYPKNSNYSFIDFIVAMFDAVQRKKQLISHVA